MEHVQLTREKNILRYRAYCSFSTNENASLLSKINGPLAPRKAHNNYIIRDIRKNRGAYRGTHFQSAFVSTATHCTTPIFPAGDLGRVEEKSVTSFTRYTVRLTRRQIDAKSKSLHVGSATYTRREKKSTPFLSVTTREAFLPIVNK